MVELQEIKLLAQFLIEMVDQEVEIVMLTLLELELVILLHLVHHKEIQVDPDHHLLVLVVVVEQEEQELLDLVIVVELVDPVYLI